MAYTLKSLKIWSKEEKKIVNWSVATESEQNENDPEVYHKAIVARYKEEFHNFSPNCIDAELERMAEQINQEGQS